MSIEIIDLESDCLANPSRLDLANIETRMLWPDDPAARSQAMTTSTAELGRQILPILSEQLVRELVPIALSATPLDAVQSSAKEPFVHGYIAGIILNHIVGEVAVDPNSEKASMGWIISSVSKSVYPKWRLSPKTIENMLWPKYRRVSHFWAAYVDRSYSEFTFPCRIDRLTEFLSTAEAFRVAGEGTRTKRSPRPVLLPGECVGLPANLTPPVVSLQFQPVG